MSSNAHSFHFYKCGKSEDEELSRGLKDLMQEAGFLSPNALPALTFH